MQQRNPQQPVAASSFTLSDIYYVLFKHKWKILIFSGLGILGAIAVLVMSKPPYVSQAKLLVRYVEDAKAIGNTSVQPMSLQTEAIMNAEASILSSLDVAGAVVDAVGAEKILGKDAKSTNRELAALVLTKQLFVEVPPKGNVLKVSVKHDDAAIVQPLLRNLIDAYFRKHVEIHRNLGFMDDSLTQLTDQAKARLAETEDALRKMKAEAGITSLDETKRQFNDRLQRVVEELRIAEVELEERRAALNELKKAALVEGLVTTNAVESTNAVAVAASKAPAEKIAPEILDAYQRLMARLESYRKREQELLANFRPESALVREARENVVGLEKEKQAMVDANPRLIEEEPVAAQQVGSPSRATLHAEARIAQMMAENSRIASLTAKIITLNTQLTNAKGDLTTLERFEKDLVPLQRKKYLEETNYVYYATTLNQARFDNSLAGGQLSNIKEIQAPSLPFRDKSSLMKQLAMTAAGGIVLGLGLAFLLEMVVDQSVRKPGELEKLRLPTFLTIPHFGNGKRVHRRPKQRGSSSVEPPAEMEQGVEITNGHSASLEVAPWDDQHRLYPYAETLRDRLMSLFELKGLTHKPKLVAITSCSRGAGVTSLAAGLAASLSETGDGNVLLVDMNADQESAHPFFKGKPACGLSDVLEHEKRPAALVQDKLYMVQGTHADERLPHVLPKRLRHLIPKLQASDYDYIIFDMPPITQTSVTPRLAGFMDMVFLVVEDAKTNREFLKQASALLQESKANLGAVFNKRRAHVPNWLHQEF